jgi:hypothetical protein
MLPLISFETGRRTQTQSSGQPGKTAPANGSLALLRNRSHGREANTRSEGIKKKLHPRSSEARQEDFCLLTKTYHGCRVTGNYGSTSEANLSISSNSSAE